MNSNGKRTVKH
jgi:hypothetical protein